MSTTINTVKGSGSDEKARYVLKNINETERNMVSLKKAIKSYLRNHERLRGKRLELALVLKSFSESESPNLKQALLNTAEAFVDLEEYHKYMHDRIESKTEEPLKIYKIICKNLKDDVKNRDYVVGREQKKQLEHDKISIKDGGNITKITRSQLELENVSNELKHVHSSFAENVERYHVKKTVDVRDVLYEMIYSEMQYHSKSLEILSNLQNGIFNMNMETDTNEIRQKLS